jgi:hypothetical protein
MNLLLPQKRGAGIPGVLAAKSAMKVLAKKKAKPTPAPIPGVEP